MLKLESKLGDRTCSRCLSFIKAMKKFSPGRVVNYIGEATALSPAKSPPKAPPNLTHNPNGRVMDLLIDMAVKVTSCEVVVEKFDETARMYVIVTKLNKVEARVLRDLKAFHDLRSQLIRLLPQLSIVVNKEYKDSELQELPIRTLRRQSTLNAKSRDLKTFSAQGSIAWYSSKVGLLNEWIDTALSKCDAIITNSTSLPNHHSGKDQIHRVLHDFLLHNARINVD